MLHLNHALNNKTRDRKSSRSMNGILMFFYYSSFFTMKYCFCRHGKYETKGGKLVVCHTCELDQYLQFDTHF